MQSGKVPKGVLSLVNNLVLKLGGKGNCFIVYSNCTYNSILNFIKYIMKNKCSFGWPGIHFTMYNRLALKL